MIIQLQRFFVFFFTVRPVSTAKITLLIPRLENLSITSVSDDSLAPETGLTLQSLCEISISFTLLPLLLSAGRTLVEDVPKLTSTHVLFDRPVTQLGKSFLEYLKKILC